MLFAIVLFAAAYVMMLVFQKYRARIALGFGLLFVLTGMLPVSQAVGAIDWNVLLMIAGMMGLVQLFIDSRMSALLADLVIEHVHSVQMVAVAVALALFAGLISAFVDNIPYVATMLPVISGIAVAMDIDPAVLYFGLLSGATLGGNCTPIGASANITGIGILHREGYEVRTTDFVRIGVPFTLAAVVPAYIYLWTMFGC
ncbi:MAG: anion permease [Clostridiales bacterium]|nr:anion permease [Clostridiales bacterium]